MSAILVGLLVLGMVLAGCGGGTGAEGDASPAGQTTAAATASEDVSLPADTPPATGTEGRTRTTGTPSETATATVSVQGTSNPASSTQEASARVDEEEESEYEIHNIIPRDKIPAILDPQFLDAEEAAENYNEHEQVLGLSIDGDHRAYPIPYLSRHEIVNDIVGGQPVAVTW